MKSWLDLLQDDRGIRAIYGDAVPPLGRLDLVKLVMKRDGPSILIDMDLSTFPAHPPTKWIRLGANTVQVRLDIGGINELRISGWTTEYCVDLDITKQGSQIRLTASGNGTDIAITADCIRVEKISAYCCAPVVIDRQREGADERMGVDDEGQVSRG